MAGPTLALAPRLLLLLLLLALLHPPCQLHAMTADATASVEASLPLYRARYPRQYAAFHLQPDEDPIVIDGRLNDTAWERVAFTEPFVDIQGPYHWSQPWFTTKVKLRYDRTTLYVAAYLQETAVWANLSQRNAVIFHDNDFEVFVDADASTHNYKEIEVNARNASWNLWLNKPYRSGGHENSTRVDPVHGFDMVGKGFRCAVHTDGPINDPTQRLQYWTVEMALPLAELARYTRVETLPPRPGSQWRINFSRVEWQVRVVAGDNGTHPHYEKIPGLAEANWVWSPQYAVAMHRPEWWGYLEFRDPTERPPDDPTSITIVRDRDWTVRYVAFQLFYAQEAHIELHGRYAATLDAELKRLFPDQETVTQRLLNGCTIRVTELGDFFWANVTASDYSYLSASIQADSLITIHERAGALHARANDVLSVE